MACTGLQQREREREKGYEVATTDRFELGSVESNSGLEPDTPADIAVVTRNNSSGTAQVLVGRISKTLHHTNPPRINRARVIGRKTTRRSHELVSNIRGMNKAVSLSTEFKN